MDARLESEGSRLATARALGAWLAIALVVNLVIHYVGLRTGLGIEGKLARGARETAGLHMTQRIHLLGEVQPLGVLEELIAVVVTALFVASLTAGVAHMRARDREPDGLPSPWWGVALVAFRRPRRVVDLLWRRTTCRPDRSPTGANGSWALDVLWPIWLFTTLTIRTGDHFSAHSRTITALQRATWLEVVAEVGFLATGALLLFITICLRTRFQRPGAVIRVGALPLVVSAAVVLPLMVIDLRGKYEAHANGAPISELRQRVMVSHLWTARERAAATRDIRALTRLEVGVLRDTDLAGARKRSSRRWQRDLVGVRPLMDPQDPHHLLAVVNTFGGVGWKAPASGFATELVVLSRSRRNAAWRFAIEVPFERWPWPWAYMQTTSEGRRLGPRDERSLLRRAAASLLDDADLPGVIATPVASARLVNGRHLLCGVVTARGDRSQAVQACVVATARRGVPLLLGALASRAL